LRIIIREPSGLDLRPTMGLDRRVPLLTELHVKYGVACTGGFGDGRESDYNSIREYEVRGALENM
jgi:hypothetical protein